jgi:hypothetical protein
MCTPKIATMKWVAGALVVLAASIVASALILTHSHRQVNVNIGGQLAVCTTQTGSAYDTSC